MTLDKIIKCLLSKLWGNKNQKIENDMDYYGHGNKVSTSLEKNQSLLKQILGDSDDIVISKIMFGKGRPYDCLVLYIDGLVDKRKIEEAVIKPLKNANIEAGINPKNLIVFIRERVLNTAEVTIHSSMESVLDQVLSGSTALFFEGESKVVIIDSKGWEHRGIEEPLTEAVTKGPRESFSENLRTNTSLVRRIIKDPHLRIETRKIGKRTKKLVSIIYLEDSVRKEVLNEVRLRLGKLEKQEILESGHIEQLIEDRTWSIFPTINYSERPDIISAKILEGRIAVMVDGTPFVLYVPTVLADFFTTSEDYYRRYTYFIILRVIRILSLFITVMLPALYVALESFHPELIPRILLISMANSREAVPFPAFLEALGMGLMFEVLREAGVRIPVPIGPAVSIVGALVLGEAAVSANIITATMVMVAGVTGIFSLVLPSISLAYTLAIIRVLLVFIVAGFGLYGLMIGFIFVMTHLSTLRSFGVSYLAPFTPFSIGDLKDTFLLISKRRSLTTSIYDVKSKAFNSSRARRWGRNDEKNEN